MSYRDFTITDVIERFSLSTREGDIFADWPSVEPSAHLAETLRSNIPVAIAVSNEKVRSELLVAPVLMELKRAHPSAIGFFSGVDLDADAAAGLTGTCDFLLSLSPEQAYVKAPIVTLVEAKRDDLGTGVGQCAAEMVGARIFNERAKNPIETVYGVVTTGTTWRFLSLSGSILSIDFNEYSIRDLGKILGILSAMIAPQPAASAGTP